MKDKVVLITGASTGIGYDTALLLGKEGAKVAVHYNQTKDGADQAAAVINNSEGTAKAFQADIAVREQVDRLVAEVREELGEIDYLVVNAGSLIKRCPVVEAPDELWDEVMAVNLSSVFYTCRAVLNPMIERRDGAVVIVSSIAGRTGGGPGATMYATAKAGALCFTKGLAKEVAPYGIRVNGVAPGVILTPFHERFSTPEVLEKFRQAVPLGRLGQGIEIANVIRFLLSDGAAYMTGETIEVNGGMLMD
ncbi:SDR family NAD(P)-dependent oxidoreductase [candidate division KSB1 bacterium]